MFAQFFGGYLFNKKLVSAQDLTQAFEDKSKTRMRLGVLAINAGIMTAQQVEHVNVTQQSVDKRFGDLAVELGYMTAEDVENLMSQQPTEYLLLGQTLVNNGVLTNAEFEQAINEYKVENQLEDSDLSGEKSETVSKLISDFYHFEAAENAKILTDYAVMLFKNIIRFIGNDFTPLEASIIREFDAKYMIKQQICGSYEALTGIAADRDEFIEFASKFAKEDFCEIDDFVLETVGEFLNVINGLFTVNESNENGVELTMNFPEKVINQNISFEKPAFCIPVAFSFGEVDFIISGK